MMTAPINDSSRLVHAPQDLCDILVVDDEPTILMVLSRWLEADGYRVTTAQNGLDAWELLKTRTFDLLISDIMMPGINGMELLAKAHERDEHLAVIIVTGVDDRRTALHALLEGAYGYIIKPFDHTEVLIAVANALERRRLLITSKLYERELERNIFERTRDIRRREEEITLHLVAASEYRDEDTGSHIRRIGQYAAAIGRALGWDEADVEILRLAAPMHDVGKIGIPDHILLKKGRLTDDEFDIMRRHTQIGAAILAHSDIPLLAMGKTIALQHHERWDGTGYPHNRQQADTDECARIVAIADVYDALVTDRIYRPAFSEAEALSILHSGRGTHFDPRLFECFMDMYPEVRRIRFEFSDAETATNLHN